MECQQVDNSKHNGMKMNHMVCGDSGGQPRDHSRPSSHSPEQLLGLWVISDQSLDHRQSSQWQPSQISEGNAHKRERERPEGSPMGVRPPPGPLRAGGARQEVEEKRERRSEFGEREHK
ncbi:hypothetical protein Sjap_020026 [Stephania japonica]|uniref:Uncharacterized protein n=1 Tax=Stephania japonica TaxID=461633 RepID=A0AAP0F2R2_9MAGN